MEQTKVENKKTNFSEKINKQITKEDLIKAKNVIQNKLKEIALPAYIIINILFILIGSYQVAGERIDYSDFARGEIILMILNVISIMILFAKNRYKKNSIHKWLLAILIIGVFSTIFARMQKISIMGFQDRHEGLLAIAYYVTLAFLTTLLDKKYKKIIINSIIITGVIQAVYGLLQTYNIYGIYNPRHGAAQGLVTNPNFYGTYMLLCISFSIGAFIDENKIIKKIIYIISSFILAIGVLVSNTMSAIVGFGIVFIYLLVYCIKKKKILKLIATIAIVASSTILMSNLGKTNVIKDFKTTTNEAKELVKGNTDDKLGSSRMYIWKNAIKLIPRYLIIGAGVDNFYFAFIGGPLMSPDDTIYYDKAHNEYLQTLITEGAFGLVAYLGLYFVVTKKGIKDSFKYDEITYILPIIGYLAQAFFNISVIEVAPIFYIAIGLCSLPSIKEENEM